MAVEEAAVVVDDHSLRLGGRVLLWMVKKKKTKTEKKRVSSSWKKMVGVVWYVWVVLDSRDRVPEVLLDPILVVFLREKP